MNVWLLHIGEDLPVDGPARRFRYSYLAAALTKRGHDVLRWAPTLRHNTKRHRFTEDRRVEIEPGYSIQFVHSPGYSRATSLARLRAYQVLGRRFRQLAHRETPPDAIIAAIPSLEWALAAVEFGKAHGVPVVVDVRDLWPDVFPGSLPFGTRSLGRWLLAPYRRMAARACRGATALTAVSESYLAWGLRQAGRKRNPFDKALPLGFEPATVDAAELNRCLESLGERGIDPARPTCLFAGAFERHHEVNVIVEAARRMTAAGRGDIQFVLCGDGSQMPAIRERAQGATNVHLLGHVGAAMLQSLSSISSIGLCAYAPGALMSLGNKPFEYMAGRMALVSSLPGELAELLQTNDCGITYRAGDSASLADCLVSILDAPARLEAMQANAFRTWSEHFRTDRLYPEFVEHLESFAARPAQAA